MLARNSLIGDEREQGAIEYILLAGGIVVAAVIVYGIYMRMTRSTVEVLNRSVDNASATVENKFKNEVKTELAS